MTDECVGVLGRRIRYNMIRNKGIMARIAEWRRAEANTTLGVNESVEE